MAYGNARRASDQRATSIGVVVGAVAALVAALALGTIPAAAFHGAGGDVIHKQIALVNGEPVEDPDPETGAQNVVVQTGDEVTYRILVSAGEDAAGTQVLVEDVYKPPQQEFVGAMDLEGADIECGLDIGTEDTTVGCDITLNEDGEGGVLLTFEIIQEAPPGEGCPQITNIATVTLAEEVEPRASNQARVDVCTATVDEGSITVIKSVELVPGEPDSAFPLPGVGFTLFDAECDAVIAGEAFTDDAGVIVFGGLDLGVYCLVETSPLDGFREIEPIEVELAGDAPAVEVEVLNEFAFNTVLLKLDCTDVDEAQLFVFDAFGEDPMIDVEDCEPGAATFSVSGGGLSTPIVVDVVELELIDLAPGAYEVSETAPNTVGPVAFEVGPDDLLVIVALNPVEMVPPPSSPAPMLPDTGMAIPAQSPAPIVVSMVALACVATAVGGRMIAARR